MIHLLFLVLLMLPAVILSETSRLTFKQYNVPAVHHVTPDLKMTDLRLVRCAAQCTKYSQYIAFWFNAKRKTCHLVSCINPNLLSAENADETSTKIYVKYPLTANTLLARGKHNILTMCKWTKQHFKICLVCLNIFCWRFP